MRDCLAFQTGKKGGPIAKIYEKSVRFQSYEDGIQQAHRGGFAHLGSTPATVMRIRTLGLCEVMPLPIVFSATGGAFALPEGSIFTKYFDLQ